MSSAIPLFTWDEALHEFYLHLQATRAQKTQRYYEVQLGGLVRWATQENVSFSGFGKRHMDRYLVSRAETGKAPLLTRCRTIFPEELHLHLSTWVDQLVNDLQTVVSQHNASDDLLKAFVSSGLLPKSL